MQFAFTLACYFLYWSSYFAYHHWGKRQVTDLVTNLTHLNLRRHSKKSAWTLDYWQFTPLQSFAYILLWYFEDYVVAAFKCGLLYYVWSFAEHSLYIFIGSHINRILCSKFPSSGFLFHVFVKAFGYPFKITCFKECSKLASGFMLWTTT